MQKEFFKNLFKISSDCVKEVENKSNYKKNLKASKSR